MLVISTYDARTVACLRTISAGNIGECECDQGSAAALTGHTLVYGYDTLRWRQSVEGDHASDPAASPLAVHNGTSYLCGAKPTGTPVSSPVTTYEVDAYDLASGSRFWSVPERCNSLVWTPDGIFASAPFGDILGAVVIHLPSQVFRYTGKARILRRLQLGVVSSLEVEDISPTSAALAALHRWVELIAEREMDKIAAKCACYESQGKPVPCWVWRGMEERYIRVEQIEHRVRMLLSVFGSYGVLPLELKPAYTVGDLVVQHLDDLEQKAEAKRGVQ